MNQDEINTFRNERTKSEIGKIISGESEIYNSNFKVGESMILIKEDFPNVIELPKMANHGAITLVLIAFHDWMAVYLCGHIRCTIEHDIATNALSIVAPVKMIMTRKYATNSKEAISTLIDMVTQRDII